MNTSAPGKTDPILRVEYLTMRFGGLVAIDALSFDVGRNDITAIIGPNGAGKTTVFNCHDRFLQTDRRHGHSSTHGDGRDFCWNGHGRSHHRPAMPGVARTFQNIRLFGGMTVLENLLVAQHNPLMLASGFTLGGLFGLGRFRRAEKQAIERAQTLAGKDRPCRPGRRSGSRFALWRPAPARDRPRHVHATVPAVPR